MARFLLDVDADIGPEEEPDAEANAEADEASRDDHDSN
jgi:hypothetical protein